jgi:hypothetical protein
MANEVWPDEAIDRLLLWLAEAPAHGVAMANWWTFHYVDSEGVLSEFEGAHASLLRRSLVDLTSGMPNWDTW